MQVAITEVFCEVVSGLVFLMVLVALGELGGVYTITEVRQFAFGPVSPTLLAGFVIGSYALGVTFDAVGMALDELLGQYIAEGCKQPTPADRAVFYAQATEHLFAYRRETWAYYSCYRNLLFLIPSAIFLWSLVFHHHLSCLGILIIAVATLAAIACLFVTMRRLINIYFEISRAVSDSALR